MEIQVDHTTYNDLNYNDKGRFTSYWWQIDSVLKYNPQNVLEIGTGSGLVKYMLQKNGVPVTTIDIDPNLKPDIVCSVLSIPAQNAAYDVALCCQVLEHLPYENFVPALAEIHRVTKRNLVLSLPDLNRAYRFNVQLPLFGEIKFLYTIPRIRGLKWSFDGEHYWNISCRHYPLNRIMSDIPKSGFSVEKTFCVFEMPWHRFFLLKKY